MNPEPTDQHRWLQRLIGRWEFQSECIAGPDQPAMKFRGTENIRAIGDLWVVGESQGEMPDGETMTSIMTLGYDPQRERFIGTWIGSPMPNMFIYEGELDSAGVVLPLNTTGPSFADPAKTATYQDVIEVPDSDNRVLWSQMLDDNGQWQRFNTAHYKRVE